MIPALHGQQEMFPLQSAAVTRELAIRTDHAMAGHDDREGISPVREADGADGTRITDASREFAIADRFAIRDRAQRPPYSLLESRPPRFQREGKFTPFAGKVFLQLPLRLAENSGIPRKLFRNCRRMAMLLHEYAGERFLRPTQFEGADGRGEFGGVNFWTHASKRWMEGRGWFPVG